MTECMFQVDLNKIVRFNKKLSFGGWQDKSTGMYFVLKMEYGYVDTVWNYLI